MNCCTAWPAPFKLPKTASYPPQAGTNGRSRVSARSRPPRFRRQTDARGDHSRPDAHVPQLPARARSVLMARRAPEPPDSRDFYSLVTAHFWCCRAAGRIITLLLSGGDGNPSGAAGHGEPGVGELADASLFSASESCAVGGGGPAEHPNKTLIERFGGVAWMTAVSRTASLSGNCRS